MIRNILWGGDGVLFDNHPAITYAISRCLSDLGHSLPLNMIDGLFRQSFADGVENIAKRFKLDPCLLHRQFESVYFTVSPEKQPPLPHLLEVCAFIQERGGVNLILANHSVQSTQALLEAHKMAPFFSGMIGQEQNCPDKSGLEILVAALENCGLDPMETLLVSKQASEVQAGQAAGFRTCWFGPVKPADPPALHIDDYSQLIEILRGEPHGPAR